MKILLAAPLLIIVLYLGVFLKELNEGRGMRPWTWILNRVIQAETDRYYLDLCLSREKVLIEKLGYEPE